MVGAFKISPLKIASMIPRVSLMEIRLPVPFHPVFTKYPAGEKCQAWLFHAESGDYRRAWETIIEDNPFPAIKIGRAHV